MNITGADELERLCGPSAFVLTCPVPEMIVVNIIQTLLVLTSCVFFCWTARSQRIFSQRSRAGPKKVIQFWTVNTWAQIVSLLASWLPTEITTQPIFECLRMIYRISALLGYSVLADEALFILKGIRFPGLKPLWILSYFWYFGAFCVLAISCGLLVIDPATLAHTTMGKMTVRTVCTLDICVGTYLVVVLSLTFVLNDAVPRSLPRSHLMTMWSLCFFVSFITLLKVIEYLDSFADGLGYMRIWVALKPDSRYRAHYAITSLFAFIYSIVSPAYLSASIILLTRLKEHSHESTKSSVESITLPLDGV